MNTSSFSRNSRLLAIFAMFMLLSSSAFALYETRSVLSPDKKVSLTVHVGNDFRYSVSLDGKEIIAPSPVSMTLRKQGKLDGNGENPKLSEREINEVLRPVVRVKNAEVPNHCRELRVDFGDYAWVGRAYNDGVAYRFETKFKGQIDVLSEGMNVRLKKDHIAYIHDEITLLTHQERKVIHLPLSEIAKEKFSYPPVVIDMENGPKIAITESDLRDYPGLYLQGTAGTALTGMFPAVALEEKAKDDRTVEVTKRADYIARTTGTRTFPWRIFVIAREDADLIRSEMVYRLAPPLELKDTSWIRPGKVAWDWYNANNVFDVDFKPGVNTATYKYYIDFAAKYGIEYIILDEGWYVLPDLLKTAPDMDLDAIFAHARAKGVGVIPWVTWKSLEDQLEPAMEQFAKWGAVGLKVDFMQRDDQKMVNYYWKIAKETAKRHMLLDFHGAYKPAGLRRAYPNYITSEGIQGAEHNKWSANSTPEHNVTMPFIRMLAGPMDYTPGAMRNAQKKDFKVNFNAPMSLGTRCHQLAMYVIFESPLQMLCDSPSLYLQEPECMKLLGSVPTVWDETRVLDAKLGEYILIARRSGKEWYVGAMTNWFPRVLTLDLSFLGKGDWKAETWSDGPKADDEATDFTYTQTKVSTEKNMRIKLAPGGGWAGRFRQ